jgi:ketosteroid isomerase-like protein
VPNLRVGVVVCANGGGVVRRRHGPAPAEQAGHRVIDSAEKAEAMARAQIGLRRAVLAVAFIVASPLKFPSITLPTATPHKERIAHLQEQRRAIDAELSALEAEAGPALEAEAGPALEAERVRPRDAIRALYKAFNDRDAPRVASLLAEDVVYEDLLLGASTICRGRESFSQALAFHPAFLSAQLGLPMGRLELVVDDVACDGERSVGVEWHVELNGEPFPLSRGLSLATINAAGELERVVDIAEAPWRVVGLVVRPLLSIFGVGTAAVGAGSVFWLGQ